MTLCREGNVEQQFGCFGEAPRATGAFWCVPIVISIDRTFMSLFAAEFPALPSSAPVRPVVNWGSGAGAASSDSSDAPSAGARVRKLKTSRGDVLLL